MVAGKRISMGNAQAVVAAVASVMGIVFAKIVQDGSLTAFSRFDVVEHHVQTVHRSGVLGAQLVPTDLAQVAFFDASFHDQSPVGRRSP